MQKPIPHKQKTPFGCNFYCLANLFNYSEDYVEAKLKEIENLPNSALNHFYENVFLREQKPKLYFDTTQQISKLSNEFITDVRMFGFIDEEKEIDPKKAYYEIFLLTIQLENQHRILVLKNELTNQIYVVDSEKDSVEEHKCSDLPTLYKIRAVSLLRDQERKDQPKLFRVNELTHLIDIDLKE